MLEAKEKEEKERREKKRERKVRFTPVAADRQSSDDLEWYKWFIQMAKLKTCKLDRDGCIPSSKSQSSRLASLITTAVLSIQSDGSVHTART